MIRKMFIIVYKYETKRSARLLGFFVTNRTNIHNKYRLDKTVLKTTLRFHIHIITKRSYILSLKIVRTFKVRFGDPELPDNDPLRVYSFLFAHDACDS